MAETKPILIVAGDIESPAFQCCRLLADRLLESSSANLTDDLRVLELFELDYDDYRKKTAQILGKKAIVHNERVLVYHTLVGYIGGKKEFIQWASAKHPGLDKIARSDEDLKTIANERISLRISSGTYDYVFLKFNVQGEEEQLVIELHKDVCPKASENFRKLCTGECGTSERGIKLSYQGSPMHRLVKNGWIQGGDIVDGRGTNGESVFDEPFEDESFVLKHDRSGIVAMANNGPHTNTSQFYITFNELEYLDCRKTAFGKVVMGASALSRLNEAPTKNERPAPSIIISSCGEYSH